MKFISDFFFAILQHVLFVLSASALQFVTFANDTTYQVVRTKDVATVTKRVLIKDYGEM